MANVQSVRFVPDRVRPKVISDSLFKGLFMRFLSLLAASLMCPIAANADVFTFETPSENIQCSVGLEAGFSDISCTIINRSGPFAFPKPAACAGSWGHVFEMNNRGPVRMACGPFSRDKSAFDKAEYGVTGRFGGFVCESATTGLTCRNEDGHGFSLSRRSQKVF